MKLFLLYRELAGPPRLQAGTVAERLRDIFETVYEGLPAPALRESPAGTLIRLELPVDGCRQAFVEEDELTWCFAPDLPVGARKALDAAGVSPGRGELLPTLCRELERRPEALLRELAPPFAAIWFPKDRDEILVQNDGLGRSQLFEHRSAGLWALTNRPQALRALGLELRPEPFEWACRWSVGHFLSEQTGFRDLRLLPPATQVRVGPRGLAHAQHETLSDWLSGAALSPEEAFELAWASLLRQVDAACELVDEPRLGLSGGRDSRVIAAALHALGIGFRASVRGEPWRADVRVARLLAERAGAPLREKAQRLKRPPPEASACKEAMKLSLVLSAGGRTAQSYKTHFASGRRLRAGRAELTGHGGEIARDYYGERLGSAAELGQGSAAGVEAGLLARYLMKKAPPFLRAELRAGAREAIAEALRVTEDLGAAGHSRLAAFYFTQRERRFIGSHGAARTGLELIPFLAPDFVRAAFALPPELKRGDAVPSRLLADHAPDWADIPFGSELGESPPPVAEDAVPRWQRAQGRHAYDNAAYWQDVGRPLVTECLERGGTWTEIFDPDAARRDWARAPDELVLSALLDELS